MIADSIKQFFHWCFFRMLSGKCLFPMLKVLVCGAGGNINESFLFFHSAFFVMEMSGEKQNAHSSL